MTIDEYKAKLRAPGYETNPWNDDWHKWLDSLESPEFVALLHHNKFLCYEVFLCGWRAARARLDEGDG